MRWQAAMSWERNSQALVEQTDVVVIALVRYRPRAEDDRPLSASAIRQWTRQVRQADGHYPVLRPAPRRADGEHHLKPISVAVPEAIHDKSV
jgi:hypothetical protein